MNNDVAAFAKRLETAYSTGSYRGGWSACIKMLRRRRGLDDCQIEAIIRSKWTRYAADHANSPRYGRATSMDLMRWMTNNNITFADVERLTRESLGLTN